MSVMSQGYSQFLLRQIVSLPSEIYVHALQQLPVALRVHALWWGIQVVCL